MRHRVLLSLAVIGVALSAGCRPARRVPDALADRPIRTVSGGELARAIDADTSAVLALKGKLTLGFQESSRAESRTCRGVLAARNPWTGGEAGLYVKGYRPLIPSLFTLVSDGHRFWLHVPRDDTVYTGPVAGPRGAVGGDRLRLDARDLFRALFVQPLGDALQLEVHEDGATYVVSLQSEGRLRRRLWVERRGFAVRREVFYDANGREELAIDRDRWVELQGRLRPARMVLRDVATGGAVLLDFDALTLDPELDAEAFRPRMPPHARTESIAGPEDGS